MKLLAGLMALASAQEADQGADRGFYGSYDYYGGYYGKSQAIPMGDSDTLGMKVASNQNKQPLGNGRECWQCNEKSYGECLGADSNASNDPVAHGQVYCKGEEYFCYIHERRIIRHDGNDYNFEVGQPWSAGVVPVTYQEENQRTDISNSNKTPNTNIRVQMGCQQPQACLRQQHQNYKIEIGKTWYNGASNRLHTLPAGHVGLAREGLCRLGDDWNEYAVGGTNAATDTWRKHEWRNSPTNSNPLHDTDRRYGAVRPYHHYGKGTESVCHYCCDALLEYDLTGNTPCNYYAITGVDANLGAFSATVNTVDTADSGNIDSNIFLKRQEYWNNPTWYHADQYHGMFRNPHTQYKRTYIDNIFNAPTDPNANRP